MTDKKRKYLNHWYFRWTCSDRCSPNIQIRKKNIRIVGVDSRSVSNLPEIPQVEYKKLDTREMILRIYFAP